MYSWNQFRNLPKIKDLPVHEQSRQYWMYQSNSMYEAQSSPSSAASSAAAGAAGAGAGAGAGGRRPTTTTTTTTSTTTTTTTARVPGVDFTIEWFMKNSTWMSPDSTSHPRPYSLGSFPAPNAVSIEGVGTSFYWWTNGTPYVSVTGLNISTNTWHHYAVTRNNGQLSGYIDGIRVGTGTFGGTISSMGNTLWIGAEPTTAGSTSSKSNVVGNITNFRWTDSVVYTGSSFSVPTSPLTSLSNTKFLMKATDQSHMLTDSSTYSRTITNPYGATWSSDSPFVGTASGSIHFNGYDYVYAGSSSDWNL
jgi:hypothetical protein